MSDNQSGFSVNASRIGSRGGLRTFTEAALQCLASQDNNVDVILPRGVRAPAGMKTFVLPELLSSSSHVSKWRPLLWLAYATFLFPVKRSRRVLSTTHQVLPFRRRQIVTVHDLRPYFEPDTWAQKLYFHAILPRALRRCDGILTVSMTSKQEIVAVYGINPAIIHVVPNAIDVPRRDTGFGTEPPDIVYPYLLMVGASWTHKNAIEVLEQHALWKHHFRLKIVAGTGQYSERLRERSRVLGIGDIVEILHDVTDATLAKLYQECKALVYPSTREGFGLPPLEAMARGKAVIVSDIPVFRELFGDVPLFVSLGDTDSWKRAIDSIITQGVDSERLNAGLELSASYSRERMCIALNAALRKIWDVTSEGQ